MTKARFLAILATAMALTLAGPMAGAELAAQIPTQQDALRMLRENPEAVRQQILQSGMTQDEIRAQLLGLGLPPDLLDQFLAEGIPPTGSPLSDAQLAAAVQALGITNVQPDGVSVVPLATGMQYQFGPAPQPDSLAPPPLPIYGLDVFRRATSQFQPLLAGPVPDSYRIGPGDQMVLVLTGEVELARELVVTREGFIVIPDVGQIAVANLTMGGLRAILRERLGDAYSGIDRGTTTFDITISRLRTNQIYVVGEVLQSGAWQLSSVATALNALYAAGGPTEFGSLRDVRIQRRTGEEISLDLYSYFLNGRIEGDVILEQGDVIFVPLRGPRVQLVGSVIRPAQYEVKEGEGLIDILRAAGGFAPDARRRRITIHRVLRPADRGPGATDRAAIDLELRPASDSAGAAGLGGVVIPPVGLQDGDSIVVDELPGLLGGYYVSITGRVASPDTVPWREGMTLRDLVELARGPTVGADLREAEISRLPDQRGQGELAELFRVPMDSSYLTLRDSLGRFHGPAGVPFPPAGSSPEFVLEPFDQVVILTQPEFEMQQNITVTGEVRVPGVYALRTKTDRLTDVIARAGGLMPTAYPEGARLFRARDSLGRINVSLPEAMESPDGRENVLVEPGDSLFIPIYSPTVEVTGAVNSPVTVLYQEGQGLDYYIENAGGYRHDADKGRVVVRYANGQAQLRDHFLFWSIYPDPGPGSVVTVPVEDPADKIDWRGLIRDVVAIAGSITTVIIVATR